MAGSRYVWIAVLLIAGLGPTPTVRGQPQVVDQQYAIKAAYLYYFGLYCHWPQKTIANGQFVIGILGKDPFGKLADEMAKTRKQIQGNKITIKRFKSIKDLESCQVLFIGQNAGAKALDETIAEIKNGPILLVTESPGLAKKGSMINLYIQNNKVKFEVNLDAVKKAKLKLDANLLRLAKIVK